MKKKKIYIAHSLTHAPQEFRIAMDELREKLRKDYEILDFVGLEKGTAQEVFEWDMNCVRRCDLLIADCTHQGIGLGMEIGVAIENNKQALIVAHEDAHVTRAVIGITTPSFTIKRYKNHEEILDMVKEKLQSA
jgi:nucleoside 2-deoxyribosyltransferase